jgi:NAD(P)-dependent dehydrogenase (short-subunit alcohol dehydrogenase family)
MGRAMAIKLAAADRELVLHGRDEAALSEVCREVEEKGGKATSVIADLKSVGGVEKLLGAIAGKPIKVLINNAGITIVKPLEQVTLADWEETFAVNVTAPFLLTQRLLPLMPPGGAIVNILSIAARQGFPQWSSYCMSKFALEGFSQSIREELRSRSIRVINVYPSATQTALWDTVPGEWPKDKMLPAEEVAEAVDFALSRPPSVLVENINIGNISGTL